MGGGNRPAVKVALSSPEELLDADSPHTPVVIAEGNESLDLLRKLKEAMSHPNDGVRAHAAERLGRIQEFPQLAIRILSPAVSDPSPLVRRVVIESLAQVAPLFRFKHYDNYDRIYSQELEDSLEFQDSLGSLASKSSPEDAENAFNQLIADLAIRDDSRRKSQAALVKPLLDAYLRTTPASDFFAKSRIAETINDALAQFELTLTWDEQPCRLKPERLDEGDSIGFWVLEPKGGKWRPLAKESEALKLPPLDVIPAPALGPWQMKEEARQQGKSILAGLHARAKVADPFAPLVVSVQLSKEELSERILDPLRDRLRAMPHASLTEKKKVANWLTGQLRALGLHLRCPGTDHPATLLADQAGGKNSRFVFYFEDKYGKPHRPFSTTNYDKFLEVLALIPSPPRRSAHR